VTAFAITPHFGLVQCPDCSVKLPEESKEDNEKRDEIKDTVHSLERAMAT